MDIKKFIKKERILWHNHFIPSLIAGLVVAFLSYIYQMTIANIILFASVGASAAILTNVHTHHLTKLRTTIFAYILAIIVSLVVYFINLFISINISINIFLLVFLISLSLFLFNIFHPPAITASLSFILLERPIVDLLYLFVAILVLLIIIRFLMYTISQNLPVKEFLKEFKKSF